jgi:DNA-binding LacI/PurR family transcriptional regulator
MPPLAELSPPKYRQILAQLRHQIINGELKAGDRLPSRPEMQKLYGISPATADKILTLLWQDNLVVRESGRGTFVADTKKIPFKNVLGFIVPPEARQNEDFVYPSSYWTQLLEGVQSAARQHSQQILLLNNGLDATALEQVDGLLLTESVWIEARQQAASDADIAELVRTMVNGISHVWVMAQMARGIHIGGDDEQGQYLATRHLLKLGHRKIAIFSSAHPVHMARRAGYRRALDEAGIEERLDWIHEAPVCATPRMAIENSYQEVIKWLQSGWKESGCTALLANNDYVALGAIKAFQEQGLEVPHDVSVVGFDGSEALSFVTPSLTTVQEPLKSIGMAATERLLCQIHRQDAQPVGDTLLPLVLKVGESSGVALGSKD